MKQVIPKDLWDFYFKLYRKEINFQKGSGSWNDKEVVDKTRSTCFEIMKQKKGGAK